MPSEAPYEYADKQIEYLRQEINAEFLNAQNLAGFDELNVISVKSSTKELYDKLESYHRMLCERVADDAYQAALVLAIRSGYQKPKKRLKRYYGTAMVNALFLLYNPVTKYQYKGESERKRQRLAEGILSAKNRSGMRDSYNIAAKWWFRQAIQYIDESADAGRTAGFKAAGVDEVQWVTQRDGKVCAECNSRDGVIYKIGSVPSKPHPRCRCYTIPVSRGSKTP